MTASPSTSAAARPHWTATGTLLLAIAPQALPLPAPTLRLDGIDMQRKRELHATIVGTALSAKLRRGFAVDDALRTVVDDAIAHLAWHWQRCHAWTLIEKCEDARCRRSLIEHIALPAMAEFHRILGEALGERLPVPPAHVTLYTSAGDKGIGLPDPQSLARLRVRDIDAATLAGVLP